jgi:hypothetical protein
LVLHWLRLKLAASGTPHCWKQAWVVPPLVTQPTQQRQLALPAQAVTWVQHFCLVQAVQPLSPPAGAHTPPLEELVDDEDEVVPVHSAWQCWLSQLTKAWVTPS